MAGLAAVAALEGVDRVVVSLGFGIDTSTASATHTCWRTSPPSTGPAGTWARCRSRTEPGQSTRTGSSSRPYTMDTLRNESSSAGTASRRFGKRRIRAGYAVRSSIRASSAPMQRWMP